MVRILTRRIVCQGIYKIEGMMCGHCEMHVKKVLEALAGVDSVKVSHEAGTTVVTFTWYVYHVLKDNSRTHNNLPIQPAYL